MTALRILTAFARSHAEECKAAAGFTGTAAYVYEQEAFMQPQRVYRDSGGDWQSEGRGFPMGTESPRIPPERGGRLLCLNMEYYGPDWHLVPKAMRALGLQYHHTVAEAQRMLAEYLRKCIGAGDEVAAVVGLYGFAPSPDNSDWRNSVLMDVGAYMPSLYLQHPESLITIVTERSDMPDREVVPIISDQCVYPGPDGRPQVVPAAKWASIITACKALGAKRAIYWRDCEATDSIEHCKLTGERMREAARAIGVELA